MSGNRQRAGFFAGILVGVLLTTLLFAFFVRSQSQRERGAALQDGGGSDVVPSGEVLALKLAHSLDTQHPVHAAMEYMRTRLEELSGGRVTLEIYPSEMLGSEVQCMEQLQNGVLAMTKTSASPMEGFVPRMAVFSLPYLFRDREHYWKVLDGELGKELLLAGESKNLRGLCYYDAGSRNFYTKDKPIMTPDDLKGLKIRVMNSKTSMDMIKALGGAPTPIAWGELYTALQQGVVDGAENNPPSYYTNRHLEVCKYFSMDGHTRIPDMLVISTKVWHELPSQIQEWLQTAADDSSVYQRNLWAEKTEEALRLSKEEGVEVFYPDQAPFAQKVAPMLEAYQGTAVGDLLNRIKEVE